MFEKEIEDAKQAIGNSFFDTLTGAIKGQLTNSGVEIKSAVVPVAGSTNTSGISVPTISQNMLYAGGGLILAFLLYKKFGRRRV